MSATDSIQTQYGVPKPEIKKVQNKGSGLGIDDMSQFLNLFVSQLKNQDPLKPAEAQDLLAQTAQIATVEQMMNMNKTTTANSKAISDLGRTTAASFLGMHVTANVTDKDGKTASVTGVVKGVAYGTDGSETLTLDSGSVVKMSEVVNVALL